MFNSRIKQAEKRINKLENSPFEIIEFENQKDKRLKKCEEILQFLWNRD